MTTSPTLHGQTRLAESCEKGLNYTVYLLYNKKYSIKGSEEWPKLHNLFAK